MSIISVSRGTQPPVMDLQGGRRNERTITGALLSSARNVPVNLARIAHQDTPYTKAAAYEDLKRQACDNILGGLSNIVLKDGTNHGARLAEYAINLSLLSKEPLSGTDAALLEKVVTKLRGAVAAYKKDGEKGFSSTCNVGSKKAYTTCTDIGKAIDRLVNSNPGVFDIASGTMHEMYLLNGLPKAQGQRLGLALDEQSCADSSFCGNAGDIANSTLLNQLNTATRKGGGAGLADFVSSMLNQLDLGRDRAAKRPQENTESPRGGGGGEVASRGTGNITQSTGPITQSTGPITIYLSDVPARDGAAIVTDGRRNILSVPPTGDGALSERSHLQFFKLPVDAKARLDEVIKLTQDRVAPPGYTIAWSLVAATNPVASTPTPAEKSPALPESDIKPEAHPAIGAHATVRVGAENTAGSHVEAKASGVITVRNNYINKSLKPELSASVVPQSNVLPAKLHVPRQSAHPAIGAQATVGAIQQPPLAQGATVQLGGAKSDANTIVTANSEHVVSNQSAGQKDKTARFTKAEVNRLALTPARQYPSVNALNSFIGSPGSSTAITAWNRGAKSDANTIVTAYSEDVVINQSAGQKDKTARFTKAEVNRLALTPARQYPSVNALNSFIGSPGSSTAIMGNPTWNH